MKCNGSPGTLTEKLYDMVTILRWGIQGPVEGHVRGHHTGPPSDLFSTESIKLKVKMLKRW